MIKTLKGKGMPFFKDNFNFGNLYVKFNVQFPKKNSLNQEHLTALKNILPVPQPGSAPKNLKNGFML